MVQRVKEKKKIDNIIVNLTEMVKLKEQSNLNMDVLCQVLASESCISLQTQEEFEQNQVLSRVEPILKCITNLYKE